MCLSQRNKKIIVDLNRRRAGAGRPESARKNLRTTGSKIARAWQPRIIATRYFNGPLSLFSVGSSKHMMALLSALCERSNFKLVHLNSRSHNGEIKQLQSALNDDYNNFQEKSNKYHISEPIIGRFFPNLVLVRSLRSSFIDSFTSPKKRCNTSQGFGTFFGQSCDCDRFLLPFISKFLSLFFLFLDFIAISDCVFNN